MAVLWENLVVVVLPLGGIAVYRKLRRAGQRSEVGTVPVVDHVVDTIEHGSSNGILAKIVHIDMLGFLAPSLSSVLKVPNHPLLLGVNDDDWPSCSLSRSKFRVAALLEPQCSGRSHRAAAMRA